MRLPALGLLALALLIAPACTRSHADEARVLAAASLVDLLNDIAPTTAKEGLTLRCSFGAPARVPAQVEHGAPADLLICAAAEDARTLQDKGLPDVSPAPTAYVALIPTQAANPAGAEAFVRLLAGECARAAATDRGFESLMGGTS